ncbi:ComF family protein [Streptacidiphilus pinicola]|uniref:ComF family protein n=1 Tax=Streptacidiphilus pinicola TaxID=2219663 RepID=UPI001FB2EB29|nr:phosphoribosyltransferase family protein [Streptacidiphilus pinicola]
MERSPIRALDAVLDLLLPSVCVGCGSPHAQLCPACRALLEAADPSRARPGNPPPGLPEVYAALPYGGAVRQALLAHKERGAMRLAPPLGRALARAVHTAVPLTLPPPHPHCARPLLLVPMPSTASATRARGHDPTTRLARAATAALRGRGVPARVVPALRHARAVADQAGLDAAARRRNLAGALRVTRARGGLLRSGHVVVVDDLVTTGASLAEAARALADAGVDVLAAAVVAAA